MIDAFRVAGLLKFKMGQFLTSPFSSANLALRLLILIPTGIRTNPKTINPGNTIYINSPMYEPPKLNKALKMARDKMDARLKIANNAPVIEIQFFIDDGNFIE